MTPEKLPQRAQERSRSTLRVRPFIYYGQELGMKGKPGSEYQSDERDIGDREAFKWNSNPNAEEADWYRGTKKLLDKPLCEKS